MKEIRDALDRLQKLQHETRGVSVGMALDEVSWFMKHELADVITLLQQAESELAAVDAATNSNDLTK